MNKNNFEIKIDYQTDNQVYSLQNSYNLLKNRDKNIKLIHIGKCGGTTIYKRLGIWRYHMVKPQIHPDFKYILTLRNPIERFVSAFNFDYETVSTDLDSVDINNIDFTNHVNPTKIIAMKRANKGFIYSKHHDALLKYFKTANNLAESLTSEDVKVKRMANILVNKGNIHMGIGWYLNNGDIIPLIKDQIIYVTFMDTLSEDINKLSKMLNIEPFNNDNYRKSTKKNKYLSDLAITNIINLYTNTDYKALEVLKNYKFISAERYNSYYKYKY